MFTLNHKYKNNEILKEWLQKHEFSSKKECLVQFFCGVPYKKKMQDISFFLSHNLPHAHIIGTTTDGEIDSSVVYTKEIIISISIFQKSTISSVSVEYESNSFDMGHKIASQLDSIDAKVMILFTAGFLIDGEQFLNGIKDVSGNKYPIAGGMASDNAKFKQTFISHQDKVILKGAVGVILKGAELNVKSSYNLGWDAVGLPMRITKSVENRVYEINGIKTVDIYKKYFGEEIANLLPKIGVEIPLIVKRDGMTMARACIHKFDDGSLLFAGDIKENKEVRFGIGSVDTILKEDEKICEKIGTECSPETIFVYSCMARRRLLDSQSNLELKDISQKCNVSGFFGNGEFFSNEKNYYLFNQTMTILALSEQKPDNQKIALQEENKIKDKIKSNNKMMHALTNMTNVMAKEWQEKVDFEIEKNKEQERQGFQKNKLAQMGEMISMIAHQWRQPLNAISASGINLSLLSSMGILDDKKVQENSEFIQEQTQKMSATIDTFMNFVKPSKESKPFKLAHTVESIMQIMGTQLQNHDIELKIKSENNDIVIIGHEDLLEQVIINILSNARDAFENLTLEKYIEITIFRDNNIPVVSIEDNAGGIPEDIREKIFNPYFTTKEQGKGTGIGLYMSKDIMKKSFGGELKYIKIKDGSRFELICGDINAVS